MASVLENMTFWINQYRTLKHDGHYVKIILGQGWFGQLGLVWLRLCCMFWNGRFALTEFESGGELAPPLFFEEVA